MAINGISDDGTAVVGSFSEVSGLHVEIAPVDHRTGSEGSTRSEVPSPRELRSLVLKRGFTGDLRLWSWIVRAMSGRVLRTEGSVVLLNEDGEEGKRWGFTRGWPTRYTGPGLDSGSSEIALETLEISHEGLSIDGEDYGGDPHGHCCLCRLRPPG